VVIADAAGIVIAIILRCRLVTGPDGSGIDHHPASAYSRRWAPRALKPYVQTVKQTFEINPAARTDCATTGRKRSKQCRRRGSRHHVPQAATAEPPTPSAGADNGRVGSH